MAKNRIDELRVQHTQSQLEQLQLKGQQERQEIDEAHQKEFEQYAQEWDHRMQEKAETHANMLAQLEEKHMRELEENRIALE